MTVTGEVTFSYFLNDYGTECVDTKLFPIDFSSDINTVLSDLSYFIKKQLELLQFNVSYIKIISLHVGDFIYTAKESVS